MRPTATVRARTTCTKNVWKLGDIVYSTPQVQANYKYCYQRFFFQHPGLHSRTPIALPATYTYMPDRSEKRRLCRRQRRDAARFPDGSYDHQGLNSSKHQIEALTGIPTSSMGQELWAFIPKNSLPYLRCLAAPPPSSCHLYYNDLSPYITTMVSNGVYEDGPDRRDETGGEPVHRQLLLQQLRDNQRTDVLAEVRLRLRPL